MSTELRRVEKCVIACDGISDDALDGGWTARGLIEYTKELENKLKPKNEKQGLFQKYKIVRNDGNPVDESAVFFVLRVDTDQHARNALLAYADSIADDNEILASDLLLLVERYSS